MVVHTCNPSTLWLTFKAGSAFKASPSCTLRPSLKITNVTEQVKAGAAKLMAFPRTQEGEN